MSTLQDKLAELSPERLAIVEALTKQLIDEQRVRSDDTVKSSFQFDIDFIRRKRAARKALGLKPRSESMQRCINAALECN